MNRLDLKKMKRIETWKIHLFMIMTVTLKAHHWRIAKRDLNTLHWQTRPSSITHQILHFPSYFTLSLFFLYNNTRFNIREFFFFFFLFCCYLWIVTVKEWINELMRAWLKKLDIVALFCFLHFSIFMSFVFTSLYLLSN